MKSKSARRMLKKSSATCEVCLKETDLFVTILIDIMPPKHVLLCLDCYHADNWQPIEDDNNGKPDTEKPDPFAF